MEKEFVHEPEQNRYLMRVDGQIASVVEYSDNANDRSFTRTFTPPPARGKGYAAEIVEFAVNEVEKQGGMTITPSCWYVEVWFEKHPERANLLSKR
ncbi:MAG: GNAT family N-acetyltransferase [Microbacteriaceae bacterium]